VSGRFEDKLRERVNAVGMVTLSRAERDALADAVEALRNVAAMSATYLGEVGLSQGGEDVLNAREVLARLDGVA